MHNEPIDSATLAAFLDGTLSAEERDRVLTVLARSDQSYEDLLEASAILGELSGKEQPRGLAPVAVAAAPVAESAGVATASTDAPVAPPPPAPPAPPTPIREERPAHRWWRRRGLLVAAPVLLAAGIAAILLVPRGDAPDDTGGLAGVPDLSADAAGRPLSLDAGWDRPNWPAVRGVDETLAPRTRAFRMGIRAADLKLALGIGDTAAARSIAASLAELAAGADLGAPIAAQAQQLARTASERGADADRRRSQLFAELRELSADPVWFDLGGWCEAARLAARAGRADYFEPGGRPLRSLDALLARVERLPPAERRGAEPALDRLRALAGRRVVSSEELAAVAAALDSAVRVDLGR